MNWKNTTEFAGLQWTTKKKSTKTFVKKKQSVETEGDEIKRLLASYSNIEAGKIASFKEFPLSRKTLAGLKDSGFSRPTDVQRESIGLALRGLDILGAAKTGSGKSLAFLVPVLEILYTKLWTKEDGLGALIITPTRELAYQIFETLRKIGAKHDFSAGLVIGGKDLKFERKRMDQLNVMICTPGRLLQHMDENPVFDCCHLQVLVLDEADRCLDMGFEATMNAIIANLPPERQTLLFSATQTKSVKNLARLSLKSPVYVSVHENSEFSTPETLQQSYVVTPLESKMDMLWSFLKHHKTSKILVFLSSCKQVRFVHLLFCRLRPGTSLLALYGSLHQLKRMNVYEEFCKKTAVVMFATDIASRGLDFPEVDWVIQLDCPEDATTYIHRVGRTARFNKNGEALMLLLPSEEMGMVSELRKKKIPIEKIELNPTRQFSIRRKFEALLARDVTLKECGQRAFKAYLKFVFLMTNKDIFDVTRIDLSAFARSIGLAVTPRVRFLHRNISVLEETDDKDVITQRDSTSEETTPSTICNRSTNSISGAEFDFSIGDDEDSDGIDHLFIGRKEREVELDDGILPNSAFVPKAGKKLKTKAKMAKKLIKKNISLNRHVNFDDEGMALHDAVRERRSDLAKSYEREGSAGIDVEKAKEIMQLEDEYDREIFKERIRQKHREKRLKEKLKRKVYTTQHASDNEICGSGEDEMQEGISLPDPDEIYDRKSSDGDSEKEVPAYDSNGRKALKRFREQSEGNMLPPKYDRIRRTTKNIKLTSLSLDKELMEELALKLLHD